MNEEYLYYSSTTYLGESGMTLPCQTAIVAILTSAFQPKKITAVIGNTDLSNNKRVLFLVWDWAGQGITIIPDGFGTHGGGGGTGLSIVLGLIKFYKIPLQQAWIHNRKAFDELAEGTLTEEIFNQVQGASAYNWGFYPIREVEKIRKGQQYILEIKREDGSSDFVIPLP